MTLPTVQLKQKRAEILTHYRHPWVYSNGLQSRPELPPGSLVRVLAPGGHLLGHAFYHPHNAIALRMITFDATVPDASLWQSRLEEALGLRRALLPRDCTAFRLIHGENDGFPGLTVDIYGPLACLQITTAGMAERRQMVAALLCAVVGVDAVYEKSDGHARRQEGLAPEHGFLVQDLSLPISIEEHGLTYTIDPRDDHKTGFYLDQRDQRGWVMQRADGLEVLDLCCYTGGFSLAALKGGALSVVSLDSSERALHGLAANLAANRLDASRQTSIKGSVFDFLREQPERDWDLVILDPPALAKSAGAARQALKAYRKLNGDAAARVRPGGCLMTFSCTGVVAEQDFRQSVFLGLRDADREARIIDSFHAGPDHPVHLNFPEGAYLKGLALYVG